MSAATTGDATTEDESEAPGRRAAADLFPPDTLDQIAMIFRSKERSNWKKYMIFSKEWSALSPLLFDRIAHNAQTEADPDAVVELQQFLNGLRKVNAEVERNDKLLKAFREVAPETLEGLVTSRRKEIGPAFLEHIDFRVQATEDVEVQEELLNLRSRIVALCKVLDEAMDDNQQVAAAAASFEKLLQVKSLDEADKMIDDMAASGGLNPALLLHTAKAYNSVKESEYTSDEIKDVMAHLYFKMKETTAQQQPAEVRILKYLLSMEDPMQRTQGLAEAFTPAVELETPNVDYLFTTPAKLLMTVQTVLQVYDKQPNAAQSVVGEAAGMMDPAVIERMRDIETEIEREFM
ncbi:hypothetical protein CYMTET_18234 [Cymbomonas tetramitiformis]|uniref:Uncharacterized protein n=1 Tax=Cymbomonas tetramitiformis TaxID=36881 RepID=A0AAE0L6G8_9CHLO|nr:hypothetical protein CYMTET_18234 [Cymbomonas tetramitiformis]